MRDRWQNRADTPPGKGTVYWHILVGRYPQVRSLAQGIRDRLVDISGLHMTPLDWLHISTLVVGSTDQISPDKMQGMLESAATTLKREAPITVTLRRVLYHPEAIMLAVEPSSSLAPMLDAARTASRSVASQDGHTTSGPGAWMPHLTLCYSTAQQEAKPLIDRIGLEVTECRVTLDTLSLVIQWGPEREWNWEVLGAIRLR